MKMYKVVVFITADKISSLQSLHEGLTSLSGLIRDTSRKATAARDSDSSVGSRESELKTFREESPL